MRKYFLLLFAFALLTASCDKGEDVIELTIASAQADCTGVGPMTCFLVKYHSDEPWSFFYDHIQGFQYEPGYEYVLKVGVREVKNPPMDASSLAYRLIKVISKTGKVSEGMPAGYSAAPETEVLTIASSVADCVGVGPRKCLLVKRADSDDWEFFYAPIEGFEYEPGYEYVIKVAKEPVVEPHPADTSGITYTLVGVLSVTEKDSENLPEPIPLG